MNFLNSKVRNILSIIFSLISLTACIRTYITLETRTVEELLNDLRSLLIVIAVLSFLHAIKSSLYLIKLFLIKKILKQNIIFIKFKMLGILNQSLVVNNFTNFEKDIRCFLRGEINKIELNYHRYAKDAGDKSDDRGIIFDLVISDLEAALLFRYKTFSGLEMNNDLVINKFINLLKINKPFIVGADK